MTNDAQGRRVFLVDDHPLVRRGLELVLSQADFEVCGEAGSVRETLAHRTFPEPIALGLEWLAQQQNVDGSWGPSFAKVAYTGLVVLKLEDRAKELGLDPLSPEYVYSVQVESGLAYVMSNAHNQPISVQPAGDPDGDGDGIGVYFLESGGFYEIYSTGIAMMALASSGHPELYADTLQDSVDYMAWAQVDRNAEDTNKNRGGWSYEPNEWGSDNSNAGYATLGLGFAQGAGITIPKFVKDELSMWIGMIQDPVDGDADDGGSWYAPDWRSVNIYKTGNLLYEMALVGDNVATQRVQDAIDYIERNWNATDPWTSIHMWKFHRQAMFGMMKGLEGLGIESLDLDGGGTPDDDWFAEVSDHLVVTQNPDGSWPTDPWGDQILSTAWALLTLEKAVPPVDEPPEVKCAVDDAMLWPPNHNMVNVGLHVTVTDDLDENIVPAVFVFGDEDDEEPTGDGTHSPDAKDLAPETLQLRAERKGDADGRVYLVVAVATDSAGNIGYCCSTVVVPLSQSKAALASVNAQAAAAKALCSDFVDFIHGAGPLPGGFFEIGDGPIIGPKQ